MSYVDLKNGATSPHGKISLKEDTQPKLNQKKKKRINMNTVCGINIAKDEIVATILSDTFKETRKFGVKLDDLFELKKWQKTALKP